MVPDEVGSKVFSQVRVRRVALSFVALFVMAFVLLLVVRPFLPSGDPRAGHNSWSYRTDGFRGFYELSEKLGYTVRRFRQTYHALPNPPSQGLLLILDPLPSVGAAFQSAQGLPRESNEPLVEWVKSGGRVVMTRVGFPLMSIAGFPVVLNNPKSEDLRKELVDRRDSALLDALFDNAPPTTTIPAAGHLQTNPPLANFSGEFTLSGPKELRPMDSYLTQDGQIEVFSNAISGTTLLTLSGQPLAISRVLGDGEVVLFSTPLPFSNHALRLTPCSEAVTLLIHELSDLGQRHILFDEFVHGFHDTGGSLRWITGTTLFYPIVTILMVVVLLAWFGAVSFGPPRPERRENRRAKEEFVLSLGTLYQRGSHWVHALEQTIHGYTGRLGPLLGSSATHMRGDSDTTGLIRQFEYQEPRNETEFLRESQRLHQVFEQTLESLHGKSER